MLDIKFSQNDIRPEDMPDFNSLMAQLLSKPKTITYNHIIKVMQNGIIFTARNEKKLIGIATLTFIYKPTAFFSTTEDVVVDEKFRGKGIAKSLMNQLIQKAKELKINYIDLTSNPKREAANGLYVVLKFEKRDTNVYRLKL